MHDRKIILVGAGHTHLSMLLLAAKQKDIDFLNHIVLISEYPHAIYSGFISGWIAGELALHDCFIDLSAQTKTWNIKFIQDKVIGIDRDKKILLLQNGAPVPYNYLSINIGLSSELHTHDANAISIRPLENMLVFTKQLLCQIDLIGKIHIQGAGASGVELALCLDSRIKKLGKNIPIHLYESSHTILPNWSQNARHLMFDIIKNRKILLHLNSKNIPQLPSNHILIKSFHESPITFGSDMTLNHTDRYLQSLQDPSVFFSGDCGQLVEDSEAHKSGAQAVYQAPVLYHNLKSLVFSTRHPKKAFNVRKKYLQIINCGDGSAVAVKFGLAMHNKIVAKFKYFLDRNYMNQFQNKKYDMVVSAVALVSGGTYQILLQAIATCRDIPDKNFLFLVHSIDGLPFLKNVDYLEFPNANKSYLRRLYTEYFGFYTKSKQWSPDIWLSLHDVTPRVHCKLQAVYCHNALPYWKPKYFHLKLHPFEVIRSYLYGFLFKFRARKNHLVISQLAWFGDFLSKYTRVSHERFVIVHPRTRVSERSEDSTTKKSTTNQIREKILHFKQNYKIVLFYPTLPRVFKKIEESIDIVRNLDHVGLIITGSGEENSYARYCKAYARSLKNVLFVDKMNHQDCLDTMNQLDGLIFPSDLESFGLPIQEAIDLNKFCLLPKKPWCIEIASKYPKAFFYDSVEDARSILNSNFNQSLFSRTSLGEKTPVFKPEQYLSGFDELFPLLFKRLKEL